MKKLAPIIIALVIVGGGTFYGGMKYGESKISAGGNFSRQNFQSLSEGQRQQFSTPTEGFNMEAGGGFLSGEVISKDEQSLTLKTVGGSSKIIFFSDSTQISQTVEGAIDDIEIGNQIMVSGSQNSDGSYTAQTIQERQLSPQNNNE